MRREWIGIFGVCVLLLVPAFAEEPGMTEFSGTVTGPDSQPVAEAELDFYLFTIRQTSRTYLGRSLGQVKSDAEGKFTFAVDTKDVKGYAVYCCLAQKEGLSCGWRSRYGSNQTQFDIKLTEPQKMVGIVQDKDGKPVSEAEVRLAVLSIPGQEDNFMLGTEPVDAFVSKTCSEGRFDFYALPQGATVEFLVRKPGMGTLTTLDQSADPEGGLTYKAGQTDIILTMQGGYKISGKVVTQEDQKPVEGVSVMAVDTKMPINLSDLSMESSADGSFEFIDLSPGDYRVAIQDNDWIAEALTVSVNANVEEQIIELTKGGQVEIKVIDSVTEEPVSGAQVNLRSEDGQYQSIQADEKGIASKQVLPGTYYVSAYRQGYRHLRDAATVVVENDKTAAVTIQLGGQNKITGLVLGPDGKPFEGADVRLIPNSGYQRGEIKTDENGQFKLGWDPEQVSWTEGEFYLTATAEDENLVGVELIGVDTEEATIKLQKGMEAKGKILNEEGGPITGARVMLYFRGSRFSTSFGRETKTDDKGEYSFNALASDQRYSVNINNAEGYGTGSQEILFEDNEGTVAMPDIVLRLADQKVSGQVVDMDDKPIANVQVYCYGQGQPNVNTKTDEDGNFTLDGVCPGEISISANYNVPGGEYMYGNVRTEGGAEDVKIFLAPQGGSQRYVPKKAPSLIDKPLPELTSYGVTVPADANSILVFAWDMNQRPSRYFVKQLAAKADVLAEKGVTVILLNTAPADKDKLAMWLSENQIDYPCGIIAENAKEMKFELGVQSLPWLILTDAEHNVVAEGFSVEELEGKLNQAQ